MSDVDPIPAAEAAADYLSTGPFSPSTRPMFMLHAKAIRAVVAELKAANDQIRELRTALIGAWVGYDVHPFTGCAEFEGGTDRLPLLYAKEQIPAVERTPPLYKMTLEAVNHIAPHDWCDWYSTAVRWMQEGREQRSRAEAAEAELKAARERLKRLDEIDWRGPTDKELST